MTRLPPRPDLDWTEEGAPRSRISDDVYFSRGGGLEETRAVFLQGCGLPEGWRGRRSFVIGELGFGTGLNALAAWAQWRESRDPGAVLHFISVEGFPLERDEAARALAPFAEVAPLAQKLLARWPVRARGAQRLWFPEDGFALTVIHADAAEALAGFVGAVDAWFLDGFTPARNRDMWDAAVMAHIATLSAPGARLATYSVAGVVRRALAAAGFTVEKMPGFSGKRERLVARLHAAPAPRPATLPYHAADCASVAIIGAGIAGASVACALRRRGCDVTVYETATGPASGASGNLAALVSPRLDRTDTPVARLYRAAYLEALACYRALGVFDACGVVERPRDAGEAAALADLLADPPLPPEHFHTVEGGALHAQAGVVAPRAAIEAMLEGVNVRVGGAVEALRRVPGGWQFCATGITTKAAATTVLIANGMSIGRYSQTGWAPLEYTRGQLEWGAVRDLAPAHGLECGTYAAPFDGGLVFGATFDKLPGPMAVETDPSSRVRNLAALETLSPDLFARLDAASLTSRAAIRTATPDRAPLAGAAPDTQAGTVTAVHEGLYLLGGFGSRGFTLGPLLGERLACEMLGEPQVLDRAALEAAHPARFLARALRRGRPQPG